MVKVLILNVILLFHPWHKSFTIIEQRPGSDTLNVSFRMYYGEFLNDYRTYDPGFGIFNVTDEIAVPGDRIAGYFNNKVQIRINGRLLKGELVSAIRDDYDICLSLTYKTVPYPEIIQIMNRVMTKLYDDQENLVDMDINKYKDALLLTSKRFKERRSLNR